MLRRRSCRYRSSRRPWYSGPGATALRTAARGPRPAQRARFCRRRMVPAWLPSAKTAIQAPTPRGDDPAVPATTTSSHVLPAFRAPSAAFTTSSFSIVASYPLNVGEHGERLEHAAADRCRLVRNIVDVAGVTARVDIGALKALGDLDAICQKAAQAASIVVNMGVSPAYPTHSPALTMSPIAWSDLNTPAAGLWITRSSPYPAMIPGTPVLAGVSLGHHAPRK